MTFATWKDLHNALADQTGRPLDDCYQTARDLWMEHVRSDDDEFKKAVAFLKATR